jgi:hypothetical protein
LNNGHQEILSLFANGLSTAEREYDKKLAGYTQGDFVQQMNKAEMASWRSGIVQLNLSGKLM